MKKKQWHLYGILCWHTTFFLYFLSCCWQYFSWFCIWTVELPAKTPLCTVFALILTITIHAVTLDNIKDLQWYLTMLYASILALWSLTKLWERQRKVHISILIWQTIKIWIYRFECNINKSKDKVLSLLYCLGNW
jgi:hypothetical protein